MKKYLILITLVIALSCALIVQPPDSMRFSVELTIIDTTATGIDSLVNQANVLLRSITYGDEYAGITNIEGKVLIEDLLPDSYNIIASGKSVSLTETKSFNGQLQDTSLYIDNNDTLSLDLIVQTSSASSLIISEIYYTGAKWTPPLAFSDQFVEIYNQSDQTLYLDSLIIADVESGGYDSTLFESSHVRMFPGDGDDYPIAPGQFIVIAQDGIDHSYYPMNSVDLSNADFEHYCADISDVQSDNVPNTIQIHKKYSGADVLYSVFNDAIVLMEKIENPYQWGYSGSDNPSLFLPKNKVIDGVEYKDDLTNYVQKRLDPSIDGGIAGGIPSYSNKSIERKIEGYENGRIIFMDNNNSSLDFHDLNYPTPWYAEGSE